MRSAFSRRYLSTLEAEQARAIADLHEAMPDAIVSRRYQVLVNGFAVSVPYARLPRLLDTGIATKVYPSYSYHLNLNRGPSVLGAPQFSALTGARGDGVKVAVVDDGVDHEHPFLDPTGFSYPPGFPKGTSGSTTAKVIAARGFAGPGANSAPLDRDNSFHGTFVAGVIAGVKTDVDGGAARLLQRGERRMPSGGQGGRGRRTPRVHRELPGVQRPRAGAPGRLLLRQQPGDRRRVRGGRAGRHGRHQLLGRRPAGRPADGHPHRGGKERRPRRRRPDHLGRERPRLLRARDGGIAGDGAGRDQRRCCRERARLRCLLQVVAPGGLPRMPFVASDTVPPSWISTNQRLVDVGSSRVSAGSCALPRPRPRCAARSRSSAAGAARTA